MQIKFLGAAGMVTGSSYLLQDDSTKILIDLGMFQGKFEEESLNASPLAFDASELSGVILTHAHLDHCGRLPILMQNGFHGKLYMNAPTEDLISITLTDAVKVAKHDEKYAEPLYSSYDVEDLLGLIEIVDYHNKFKIGSFEVEMFDAGHILGSTSLLITHTPSGKVVLFSGDLGCTPQNIVKPTEYIPHADYVIMESTYGGRVHPSEDPSIVLQSEINAVEDNGGVLMIPAFSLERTQELLHRIDHLKSDKKLLPMTPVFLDSPMGIKATVVYRDYPNLFNKEMHSHVDGDDPFIFPGLSMTIGHKESMSIGRTYGAKVIIAGSGMMSGGRILGHVKKYISSPQNRLLIVGYQGEGTLGREIQEGAQRIVIDTEEVEVNATITEATSMSAHADEPRLLNWLSKIEGVQKLFLTHGDNPAREALKTSIESKYKIPFIKMPVLNEEVQL